MNFGEMEKANNECMYMQMPHVHNCPAARGFMGAIMEQGYDEAINNEITIGCYTINCRFVREATGFDVDMRIGIHTGNVQVFHLYWNFPYFNN